MNRMMWCNVFKDENPKGGNNNPPRTRCPIAREGEKKKGGIDQKSSFSLSTPQGRNSGLAKHINYAVRNASMVLA